MLHIRHLLCAIGMLCLSGCMKPELPPDRALAQGMADVLVDTGLYSAVAITRTIGNHGRV